MSHRVTIDSTWHLHFCGHCDTSWRCAKPDCRNTDDCTPCDMQQRDEFFQARGDSAEQFVIPMEQHS